MGFGDELKRRRVQLGLDQRALGRKTDTAYSTIQAYETRSVRIGFKKAWELSKVLGWSIVEMGHELFEKGKGEIGEE